MKERPILFSGPMIRAILAREKRQTRRVMKPQPTVAGGVWSWPSTKAKSTVDVIEARSLSPYGTRGDGLWVKETIRLAERARPAGRDSAVYAADGEPTMLDTWPWKRDVLTAIHCPRGLSRIDLKIDGIRCERLGDMTEEDAALEGTVHGLRAWCSQDYATMVEHGSVSTLEGFSHVWRAVNGPDSWDPKLWVWAIAFDYVTAQGEQGDVDSGRDGDVA